MEEIIGRMIAENIKGAINKAYDDGVKDGVQQMMDKIQEHCRAGKPVLCNGELYFFKDARQNLIDIMDSID